MKKRIGAVACCLLLCFLSFSPCLAKGKSSGSRVRVKAHTTKKGTHVASHDRTKPNKSKKDNWSTKGNTNPETGKKGTVDPYKK